MSDLTVTVQSRESTGKNKNRQLRGRGNVPAVVYGGGLDPANIQVPEQTIDNLLRTSGENAVFLLALEGTEQQRHAMIKEMDVDPLSGRLRHIDFQRVNMQEKIRLQVPVELIGEPYGVRMDSGMVDFINREVEVECLPGNIPDTVTVDIEALQVGDHVEAKDLTLGEGVELIDEPEKVLAAIAQAKIIEDEPEVDEEELEVEGEEVAEDDDEGDEE